METITQISTEKLHYLYTHTRLDTLEVFYVGIGTSFYPNSLAIGQKYDRAFHWYNRSS